MIRKFKDRFRRFFWHGYWSDPAIFFSLVLAVLVNAGIWAALFFTVESTDRPVILHYNVYFGVDSIGNWKNVYMMPALSAGLFMVNAVLSRFFYYKERLASYLFAGMAFLIQVLMAVGVGSVILINF